MSFHEVRFPTDISFGSLGGPEYSTDIITTHAGFEQRNVNWANSRARYNVSQAVRTKAQIDEVVSFFRSRQGRAYGFRFKDWADFSTNAQEVGIGDGAQTVFQLVKDYSSGAIAITREIKKPVDGSVKIYFDSIEQLSGWSVDRTNGLVTFSTAPANGVVVSADFEFDVPVRFGTDFLSSSFESFGTNSINDIPLIEIRV